MANNAIDVLPIVQRGMPDFWPAADDFLGNRLQRFCRQLNALSANMQRISAGNYSAVSTTELTLGLGERALQIEADKSFVPGQDVLIADAAAPATRRMVGVVIAYDPATGDMTIEVERLRGSGTGSDWHVAIAAAEPPAEASEFEVGAVALGVQPPRLGTWIEAGKVYLQASYPALFGVVGIRANRVPPAEVVGGNLSANQTSKGVHRVGGKFIAVGAGSDAATSVYHESLNGGQVWVPKSFPVARHWVGSAAGNGRVAALSQSSHVVVSADEGATWTEYTAPLSGGMCFVDGYFRIISSGGPYTYRRSVDGVTWEADPAPPVLAGGVLPHSFAYGNGIRVPDAVFDGRQFLRAGTSAGVIEASVDGATWTAALTLTTLSSSIRLATDGHGITVVTGYALYGTNATRILNSRSYDPATQFHVPPLSNIYPGQFQYTTWVKAA